MIQLDAHLSPRLAGWIQEQLGDETIALREIGLRDADDNTIFEKAREAKSVILTKDRDLAEMVGRIGPPPTIIWLRCGNTTEANLKELLANHLNHALDLLASGEQLVEIRQVSKHDLTLNSLSFKEATSNLGPANIKSP